MAMHTEIMDAFKPKLTSRSLPVLDFKTENRRPPSSEYLIDTASTRTEPALAQASASAAFALEPSLKSGNEEFHSNVDEADSPELSIMQ